MIGQIVFCPRKTGSASISRSWTKSSGNPTIHTHDMMYLIVSDVKNSSFFNYVKTKFNKYLSYINYLDETHIEYTIIPNEDLENILKYFTSFKIITSVRHPLPRRISQFTQDITLDQINATIDAYKNKKNIHLEKVDTSKKLNAIEICKILNILKNQCCPVLKDSYTYINKSKNLLTNDEVIGIFKKRYIEHDTLEFSEFFNAMYRFVVPDFSFDDLLKNGYSTQIYKIFGKDVNHKLFKLEDLSNPIIFNVFREFTGISELSRDHNSSECINICADSNKNIKHTLLEKYKDTEFSKKCSLEYNITKGFGYY